MQIGSARQKLISGMLVTLVKQAITNGAALLPTRLPKKR